MDLNDGDMFPKKNQVLNLDKYMNIDEFMEVLREAELITPFGKLQTDADVHHGSFRNVQRYSFETEKTNSCNTRRTIIPLTPVVVQVIDFERNLRDADMSDMHLGSNKLFSFGPQDTKKIIQDSKLTNYLLLLSDKDETRS